MAALDPPLHCFLAERYQPAVIDCGIDEVTAALGDTAARLQDQGLAIRLLTVLASPTDQVLYAVFAAESANTVFGACQGAGWPDDRIIGGIRVRIPAPPATSTADPVAPAGIHQSRAANRGPRPDQV